MGRGNKYTGTQGEVDAPSIDENEVVPTVDEPTEVNDAPEVIVPETIDNDYQMVTVLQEFFNIYIGGSRYSGKKGQVIKLPTEVAYRLRLTSIVA